MVREGEWDQAIGLLEALLRSSPNNPKVHNLLGLALTGKGDLNEANKEFRTTLDVDPSFYPALKNLAINELTLKQPESAEKRFAAALRFAPRDPVCHAYLGAFAFERHHYQEAMEHFDTAGAYVANLPGIRLDAVEAYLDGGRKQKALDLLSQIGVHMTDTQELFRAGYALARRNLYGEAIPYFQAVRDHSPQSYDAAFNLAVCFVQTKQFSPAIDLLTAVRERGNKTAEVDNLLAAAYEGDKRTREAMDILREAATLEPLDENNYLDLAALCSDHEAYELAIETLNVGLHYLPNSDRLVFQRGVIYAMTGQFDRAESDFELASSLAPEKDLAYVGLGITYMEKSNLPQAVNLLRQRTREKPGDYVIQYLLGEALLRSGARPGDPAMAEARTALEKSVKLNASFARSRIELGKILLKQDRVDEAVQQLERARELDPKDKAVYSQLATAYQHNGRDKEASAALATVIKLNDEQRERESHNLLRIVRIDSPQDATPRKDGQNGQQLRSAESPGRTPN
jgi:tetratricopeptide (TPR) repeat protein